MKNTLFYLLLFLFFSCEKEENPVPKHKAGNARTISVSVSPDYKYQVFFNLETRQEVSRNLKTDWDLGFFTADDRVFLNSSKVMLAAEASLKKMEDVTDTVGLSFKWDYPSLHTDSLSLSFWEENKVYVLQLGVNEKGENLGLRKIQFSKNENQIKVIHANLDNSDRKEDVIIKDENYHAVYFSVEKGFVKIEPPKHTWDLVFTQYTHVFRDPMQTYLVLGLLLSPDLLASREDSISFEDVTYDYIKTQTFSAQRDLIGYDWKEYSFDSQLYKVFSKRNYLLNKSGKFYKMHFIDFYDQVGQKGNPTFELQAL